MKTGLLLAATLLLSLAPVARTQTMQAVSTSPRPDLQVVLTWPSHSPTQRYNLYRKIAGAASYPATPLNARPLERRNSCRSVKAVIPLDSIEWRLIEEGLTPGGHFDPCAISTLAANSPEEARLQFLARTRWKIALVAGQGYVDKTVTNGTSYEYELRAVNAFNAETGVIFTSIPVRAGTPKNIPPPEGVSATAGDSRVLLLWGRQDDATGFAVLRSSAPIDPYVRVNEADFVTQVKEDVDGKPLANSSNGFLDIQRWAEEGVRTSHLVKGVTINGPANGVTYLYKVVSLDLLGQQGPMSASPVSAKPLDKTPPMAPTGVAVTPVDTQDRLEVRWSAVSLDAEGHLEDEPIARYRLYRYESENAPLASGKLVGTVAPSPAGGETYLTASDNDPSLRPPFGEKTFWYRVEALDTSDNLSARSAAVGAHLKDITPPVPPVGIAAEGADNFIAVRWKANTEPDLDGYLIYRTLCDHGAANPCDPDPQRPEEQRVPVRTKEGEKKIPCTGEYVLVGTVSQADAKKMGGTVKFEDHTVPAGSPLCYSYWIKAYDQAQNKSGKWPVPDPATEETVCQRLRDKMPPEPAVISALFARDQAIRVEWVGPPVQDIRAYHVYRSDNEKGTYKWVGGMTVEQPPQAPKVMAAPYAPPGLIGCAEIPLVTIESMSMSSFIDTKVDPKSFYWYKVVGIDQSGNEAPLDKAAPMSTFTFTTRQAAAPAITSVTGTGAAPWALVVRWTPAFDAAQHKGFALFRSDQADGLYRQIGTLLNQAEYQDNQVVKNTTYWYKVVLVDKTGRLSPPSPTASGMLPP